MPLIEFAYNSSYEASIQIASYKALYDRRCRSPFCWDDVRERRLLKPEIVQLTIEKASWIRDYLQATQSKQKCYVNNRKRSLEF